MKKLFRKIQKFFHLEPTKLSDRECFEIMRHELYYVLDELIKRNYIARFDVRPNDLFISLTFGIESYAEFKILISFGKYVTAIDSYGEVSGAYPIEATRHIEDLFNSLKNKTL